MLLAKGNSCFQKTYEGFHEWKVWRESLHDFVQLLFQNEELLQDNHIYLKKEDIHVRYILHADDGREHAVL